ncbi:G-type lectin S-receptor-like serine/threonine-protein kinase At4g03230 [Lactuca sativa]|uniref:G-type lectin S-receptor-like serine/threonine-protein kinase At4g03230 n=1 Tax=Lactuca sativa TaxID=4236 RepID=UPI0022AFAA06|nr:G-type lectin S-receptor-like serine/threonine-protein kinase At4g03230 [Lactuca sativa]
MTNCLHYGVSGADIRALKLVNSGNVALMDVSSGNTLWQSFKTPTDTYLPGMKLTNILTLTSWKSLNDPGTGIYQFRQGERGEQSYLIMKDTKYYWKSGNPKNSFDDNTMFPDALSLLSNTTTRDEHVNTTYNLTYMVTHNYSRLVMNYTGHVQYFTWGKASKWVLEWEAPRDYCTEYHVCGSYGMCNQTNHHQRCSCLTGFQPASRRDPKAGCKRKSEICETTTDTFLNLTLISVDDTDVTFQKSINESVCIEKCLENCECVAYAYRTLQEEQLVDESRRDAQGCWFWHSQIYNLKAPDRHNISIRVSAGHQVKGRSEFQKLVVPLAVGVSVLGVIFLCVVVYISYRRLVNRIAGLPSPISGFISELESNNMSSSVNELPRPDDSREANEYQDGDES